MNVVLEMSAVVYNIMIELDLAWLLEMFELDICKVTSRLFIAKSTDDSPRATLLVMLQVSQEKLPSVKL